MLWLVWNCKAGKNWLVEILMIPILMMISLLCASERNWHTCKPHNSKKQRRLAVELSSDTNKEASSVLSLPFFLALWFTEPNLDALLRCRFLIYQLFLVFWLWPLLPVSI
jgi:hypothetical protein